MIMLRYYFILPKFSEREINFFCIIKKLILPDF